MHKKELEGKIEKVLNNEISSMIFYFKASSVIDQSEISEEISNQGKEKGEIFKQILSFSYRLGLNPKLSFNDKLQIFSGESEDYISKIQDMEKQSIKNYKEMVAFLRENNFIELENFFNKIINDKIIHLNNKSLFEQKKNKVKEISFKDFILENSIKPIYKDIITKIKEKFKKTKSKIKFENSMGNLSVLKDGVVIANISRKNIDKWEKIIDKNLERLSKLPKEKEIADETNVDMSNY